MLLGQVSGQRLARKVLLPSLLVHHTPRCILSVEALFRVPRFEKDLQKQDKFVSKLIAGIF